MLEAQLKVVDQIILDNLPSIEHGLRDLLPIIETNTSMVSPFDERRIKLLDPILSAISEMPICPLLRFSVGRLLEPAGFKLTKGLVFNEQKGGAPTQHYFFSSTSEVDNEAEAIVCLVPGQFVDSGELPDEKGAKLDKLVKQAPLLVKRMSDEIAVLRGNRQDISTQLGLNYITDSELSYYFGGNPLINLFGNIPEL